MYSLRDTRMTAIDCRRVRLRAWNFSPVVRRTAKQSDEPCFEARIVAGDEYVQALSPARRQPICVTADHFSPTRDSPNSAA